MSQRLLFLVLSIFLLNGCGPEQTARDAANKVSDEYVKGKSEEYRRYEGTYHGTARGAGNSVMNIELTVILFNVFVIDGSSNEVKEVPNLHASMGSCPGGFGADNKQCLGDSLVLGLYTVGQIDSVEGMLKFTGAAGTGINNSDLILNVTGGTLDGMLYTNAATRFKSKIHLEKVN